MKKSLKKLISLLAVFVMVVALVPKVSAITFPDVSAADQEAVQALAAFSILKGYDDGTFGGDRVITRAEMMTVATRLIGMEDFAGKQADTVFPDVTAAYWFSGYIKAAYEKGIVVGYPDGTFGPDKTVTFAEAVTIIARALGYAPKADEQAWPSGYLDVGNQTGFTKGVTTVNNDGATRSVVAKMLYQALGVNLMVRNYYGPGEKQYGVDSKKTVLSEYLSVAKVRGTIVGYDYATSKAQVLVSDNFASSIYSVKPATTATPTVESYNDSFYAGNLDIMSLVGRSVVAYISVPKSNDVDKTPTLKVVLPDPTVKTLTITSEDLVGGSYAGGYYTDKFNHTAVALNTLPTVTYAPTVGADYDVITLTASGAQYTNDFVVGKNVDVVKSVDTVNKQIVLAKGSPISYAAGSDVVLTDSNGAVVDPSALTAGSAITYTTYVNSNTISIPTGMKVIRGVVTQPISGTVSDLSYTDVAIINGTKYDILGGTQGITLGASGTFNVSSDNIIFGFVPNQVSNGSYGVVVGLDVTKAKVAYYDASGNLNAVPLAGNVLYNGKSMGPDGVTPSYTYLMSTFGALAVSQPCLIQAANGQITSVTDVTAYAGTLGPAGSSAITNFYASDKSYTLNDNTKITSNTVVLRARNNGASGIVYTPINLLSLSDDQVFTATSYNVVAGVVGLLIIDAGYKIQSSDYNLVYIMSNNPTVNANGTPVSQISYTYCAAGSSTLQTGGGTTDFVSDAQVGDVDVIITNGSGIITDIYSASGPIGSSSSSSNGFDTASAKYGTLSALPSQTDFLNPITVLVGDPTATGSAKVTTVTSANIVSAANQIIFAKTNARTNVLQLLLVNK